MGLGIQDLLTMNKVLIAYTAWRIFHAQTLPWELLLRNKYLDLARTCLVKSRTLKTLEEGLASCQKGIIWRLANGQRIKFWCGAWLKPNFYLKSIIEGPFPQYEECKIISDYRTHNTWIFKPYPLNFLNRYSSLSMQCTSLSTIIFLIT